jgi:hypothetical protein
MELEGILIIADLAEKIGGMVASILARPTDITEKPLWQTVTVVNQTQHRILPAATYFESGRFWTAPALAKPFDRMLFSVCNADYSFFTGATGGVVMQIILDEAKNIVCNVGIGFGTPYVGPFDINAVFDANDRTIGANPSPRNTPAALAQASFTNSSNALVQAQSATFSGTDTNGNPTTVVFKAVAIPGQEAMITITQQVVSGGN